MGTVTIGGLGPADAAQMTGATLDAIASGGTVRLRTSRHPAAAVVEAPSYDRFYERFESFDAVYSAIVEDLVELSRQVDVLYLVPGAPTVAEATVERLLADDRVECVVLPALSFLDLAWARLRIDPIEAGVRLVDGHRFRVEAAGGPGALLVAQCSSREVLSDIKLALDEAAPKATLLHHLGLEDERIETVEWADIDRTLAPDHLTSLYIPMVGDLPGSQVVRFEELVRHLRSECPWDRRQTHGSLRRFLVEETYEVVEALDELEGDGEVDVGYEHLEEELGDLLFQIVFHSVLAAEQGRFTLADVASGIHDKLVRRHPNVFDPSGDDQRSWEELKSEEKGGSPTRTGTLDRLTPMPPLELAVEVSAKAARAGFDWPSVEGPWAKLHEEIDELREAETPAEVMHEFGDVLLALVNLGRHMDVEPESSLRAAVTRFRNRFTELEQQAASDGSSVSAMDIDELQRRWAIAKAKLEA